MHGTHPKLKPINVPLKAIDELEYSLLSTYWGDMSPAQWEQFMDGMRLSPRREDLVITLVSEDGLLRIADGRHRHRACVALRLQKLLSFVLLDTEDINEREKFTLLRNANRRHLNSTQRGLLIYPIIARLGWATGEAANAAGIDRRTMQRINNAGKAGLHPHIQDRSLTLQEASDLATPKNKALLAQVRSGEMSVHEAGRMMKERAGPEPAQQLCTQSRWISQQIHAGGSQGDDCQPHGAHRESLHR